MLGSKAHSSLIFLVKFKDPKGDFEMDFVFILPSINQFGYSCSVLMNKSLRKRSYEAPQFEF